LVDIEGDSCSFIVGVDGDHTTKATKDRCEQIMATFCHDSVWIVSEFRGLTSLKSTLSLGCTVQLALVWHANAPEAPAKFQLVRALSWLDRVLPTVPVAVLGQPLFFASQLVDLSSPCEAGIREARAPVVGVHVQAARWRVGSDRGNVVLLASFRGAKRTARAGG
jgi:hypothetical protein